MKERPILFSAPMVRAILEGRKTQTRRVVRLPDASPLREWEATTFLGTDARHAEHSEQVALSNTRTGEWIVSPYGVPGDRLWVREAFKPIASGEVKDGYGEVRYGYAYRADAATIWTPHPTVIHDLTGQPATGPMQFQDRPWKPSIHMPRRASRLTLEVTRVSVERLHSISSDDAFAEGIDTESEVYCEGESLQSAGSPISPERYAFATLWRSINGNASWEANPWVWVVEFRRMTHNKTQQHPTP